MTAELIKAMGELGGAAALAFGAMGSALGTGAAGLATIGAWKKCYQQNKLAPFMLIAFVGAPLSQTIYGMIVQGWMVDAAAAGAQWPALVGGGILGGMAIGMSAWMQGRAGAAGSDALAETGKGFGNYLMALGVIETVAIFVLIFIKKVITA